MNFKLSLIAILVKFISGTAHSIYEAWADNKYMAINGVGNTVGILNICAKIVFS